MAKTIAHYRSDLRLDLKDGSTLWSDAELDRSIEKAVADLSRFIPLQKQVEFTVDAEVSSESFTTPAAGDTTYYENALDISGVSDGQKITLDKTRPDIPRPVILTVVDADESITQLHFIVKGYDVAGVYIEESFWLKDGLVQTGKVYFASIAEGEIDEIAGNGAADTLSLGTSSNIGVQVQLSTVGIKFQSETISSKTRDTDYEMDYSNGRITMKSGGSLGDATAYNIKYTKSRIVVDISSIKEDLIRIERIEYPVGQIYQNFSNREIWGDTITITGDANTQVEMSDQEHVLVKYLAQHSPPGDQSAGSYPEFLDVTVQLVAGAYALFIKAVQYEHQSVTDLASLRTELDLTTGVHTLTATALDKVTTYVSDADTALDAAIVQFAAAATALGKINSDETRTYLTDADTALGAAVTQLAASATALAKINNDDGKTYLTDADGALDSAATAIAKVITYLETNTDENSKTHLTKITTDIAGLRTAILTAQDAANAELDAGDFRAVATHLSEADSALDKVTTYLEDNTNEDSKSHLTKITTDIADLRTAIATALTAANTYLDEVDTTDLGQANVGAEAYLETGDDLINQLNDGGETVANKYAEYSKTRALHGQTRTQSAIGYVQEATTRINNLLSYIQQADGWGGIATGFINEAVQRIGMAAQIVNRENVVAIQAAGYVSEAASRLGNLQTYVEQADAWGRIANGFVAEAGERISEAVARLSIADRYIQEASGRNSSASGYIAEASQRIAIADRYLSQASQHVANGSGYVGEASGRLEMSRTFIEEAAGRLATIDRYLAESTQYQATANTDLQLADRFRAEATERRNEAFVFWSNPSNYAASFTQGARASSAG